MKQFGRYVVGVVYVDRPTVSAIITNNANQIAAVEARGKYFLPGGGVEGDETVADALGRELREKLGWEIEIGDELCRADQYCFAADEGTYFNKRGVFFPASISEQVCAPHECEHEPPWLSPDEFAANAAHRSHIWAIEQFLERKV